MPSHHHHHDHSSCSHDHSGDLPSSSTLSGDKHSLYAYIDRDHVVALNALGGGEMGKRVVKPWEEREQEEESEGGGGGGWCQSEDEEDGLIVDREFSPWERITRGTTQRGGAFFGATGKKGERRTKEMQRGSGHAKLTQKGIFSKRIHEGPGGHFVRRALRSWFSENCTAYSSFS